METSLFVRRVITFLLLFILWIPIFSGMPKVAFAADEFGTTYDVIYDVGEEGVTTVTEKVILKNLTSEYYASQFKLIIGATQISDIKASDGSGPMEVKTEQKNSASEISVKFNQQVAGINKTLPWTLSFKSKDFAEKTGKIWEVRAPKVSTTTNLEDYNLTISVPLNFGEPTLISPAPKSQTSSNGKLFLTFSKNQLTQSGVSANFGSIQLFDFDLNYHLENSNLIPIITNITLPPDTAFQDIIFQRIDPKPINVTIDNDGNYLAWYRLSRGQKLDVKVIGSSKLYTNSKAKDPNLDDNLKKIYTQSQKYWEKDNPAIVAKLAEILGSTPPSEMTEKIKLIYRYVVNNLKYDSTRLNGGSIDRLGAVTVLNNPQAAVCMEFTDLFIALSRAAGIPARELDGYAYTSNTTLRPLSLGKDVLHAWPEYWDDKKGWIMVDPTWENTTGGVDYFSKLDLNHFVFAIKGLSSSQPIPAGSYKFFGQDSKDVKVTLSDNDFLGKPQLDVTIDAPNPILAGFPGKIKVKVSNLGNATFPSTEFRVLTSKLNILNGSNQKLGDIPSYAAASFEVNFRTKSLFDTFDDQILVLIGSQKFSNDVRVLPFWMFRIIPFVTIGVIILILAVYLGVLSFHLYKVKHAKKK